MFLPFQPEPALDGGGGGQDFFFEIEQRSGQGRDEVGNHAYFLVVMGELRARLAMLKADSPNQGKDAILKVWKAKKRPAGRFWRQNRTF
ncbi:hypothetical protein GCM10007387_59550 [Pseudoduganella albidiflava]|uniref:Uncharacterized protein n=1 Tax=Pseudoduganella albidiflava TaxID=321983 RepID=A0AA87Y0R8_9BURK|nr:hypothetical protein GCM10007387_59550 [Pseudoduganella albidiflava]